MDWNASLVTERWTQRSCARCWPSHGKKIDFGHVIAFEGRFPVKGANETLVVARPMDTKVPTQFSN